MAAGAPISAKACAIALLLAVDVSGSVDAGEYRLQMQGLADALRSRDIADALIGGQAEIGLTQWSGEGRQHFSIPWRRIESQEALARFAGAVAAAPRAWRNFSTGVGEALAFGADRMAELPRPCRRWVIDVSGDGPNNEGAAPETVHPRLAAADVTVNGLAIEGAEPGLTAYYRASVIRGPDAFVITANGFADYPRAIRLKLERELLMPVASAD